MSHTRAEGAADLGAEGEIETSPGGLIRPGGKVDPEALRRAVELARASSDEPPRVRFELLRDPKQPRLDKYLCSRIDFMSRSQVQQLVETGAATVNGRTAKASSKLRRGDAVELMLPPPPDASIVAEDIPVDVLYEDRHLIVLNKSPDIIVHPARGEHSGTLLHALLWHFGHASESGGELSELGREFARPGVVHRLDRRTSGCIVFAKTEEAHWKLGAQFEHRSADKRYLAVVQGSVEPGVDSIDLPLGPHPSKEKGSREKQVVRRDALGKPALTVCRVRERYRLHDRPVADQRFSLVELELKTGRTHQIRVHLSERGYPIVGDDMYGGRPFALSTDGGGVIERQMLHAGLLTLEHPVSGEPLVSTAPVPEDMRSLVGELRAGLSWRGDPDGSVPLARFGL
ncbi:MAG: RluA family pseudouridine synthase [Planctomycetota bacterium]